MIDVEEKALALAKAVQKEHQRTGSPWNSPTILTEALYRAIEQHEAFRQDVSDAIQALKKDVGTGWDHSRFAYACNRFIITKPDPLAEAWIEATGNTVGMEPLNEAIQARGGKIVWEDE